MSWLFPGYGFDSDCVGWLMWFRSAGRGATKIICNCTSNRLISEMEWSRYMSGYRSCRGVQDPLETVLTAGLRHSSQSVPGHATHNGIRCQSARDDDTGVDSLPEKPERPETLTPATQDSLVCLRSIWYLPGAFSCHREWSTVQRIHSCTNHLYPHGFP